MSESPIFIVGCPRSGTTLLRNLLRSHPRLAFPMESHFIPALYRGYGDPGSARAAESLAAAILGLPRVRAWGLALDAAEFRDCRSFREVVSRIYGEWAHQQGKPRWGDKTPRYVAEIPTLAEIFPSCKVIHIVRDGRDVALSWLRVGFDPRNVYMAANAWKHYVTAGRTGAASLPDGSYLEICYETLLSQPETMMREVCAFLDEPFTEAVLETSRQAGRPLRSELFARGGVAPENQFKWKQEMSVKDRALFESVAGDLLASLGYEAEGMARRVSGPERVLWRLHHSFWWFVERLRTNGRRELIENFAKINGAAIRARWRGRSLSRE